MDSKCLLLKKVATKGRKILISVPREEGGT